MKMRALILVMFIVAGYFFATAQTEQYYKMEFTGAATKPIFPLYILVEDACLPKDLHDFNHSNSIRRSLIDKTLTVLTIEDYVWFSWAVDSMLYLYGKTDIDSLDFNVFIITKYCNLNDEVSRFKMSRFDDNVRLFYINLYQIAHKRFNGHQLLAMIKSHITFLEEQQYRKKLLR